MHTTTIPLASLGNGRAMLLDCSRLCPCAGIPFEDKADFDAWADEVCRDFEVTRADAIAVGGEVYGFDFDPAIL